MLGSRSATLSCSAGVRGDVRRKTMRRNRPNGSKYKSVAGGLVALIVIGALGLAGCGSSEPESAASSRKSAGKVATAPRTGQPDMVTAVSRSKTPGNRELRFNIPQRPRIGEPAEIQLVLTPAVELERLVARFQVPEGLELVSGAEMPRVDRPTPGVDISHTLTVVPKSDGIFNITAVVLTDSPTESVSRTFSIPLIAGAGLPEAPAASMAPPPPRPN